MTVDNDFKWKKPGLTSMQEKKTWIFSMIVVVKKERKKFTHIKNNQTKLWSVFFPLCCQETTSVIQKIPWG